MSDSFKEPLYGSGHILLFLPLFSVWQIGPYKEWAGFPQEPGPPFT